MQPAAEPRPFPADASPAIARPPALRASDAVGSPRDVIRRLGRHFTRKFALAQGLFEIKGQRKRWKGRNGGRVGRWPRPRVREREREREREKRYGQMWPDAGGKKTETRICNGRCSSNSSACAITMHQPPSLRRSLSFVPFLARSFSLFLSLALPLFLFRPPSLHLPHISANEIYLPMRERETRNLHACRCM